MKKSKNKIPRFRSEKEEREFWLKNNSNNYIDWKKAKNVSLPNLKLTTKSISIRLPESMIEELKVLANKKDIPYQSLLKIYLADSIKRESQSVIN